MVRSSLVENRIRFDSDKGGGGGEPDRSNPAEMAAREARVRASVGYGTQTQGGPAYSTQTEKEAFAELVDGGDFAATQERERQAAQRQATVAASQAQARADANESMAQMARSQRQQNVLDPVVNLARQRLAARPSTSTRTSGLDRSFFGDAYQDLYGQNARGTALNTVMQGGPASQLVAAYLNTPSPREQSAMTAGEMFSLARQSGQGMSPEQEAGLIGNNVGGTITNTSPMFDPATGTFSDVPIGGTGGTMSTGFLGAPVYSGRPDPNYVNEDNPAFQRQVRGNFGDEQDRGDGGQTVNVFGQPTSTGMVDENAAAAGAIPSSELALNYLQNPYYAYSGFGNQYSPYGYANNTLVDLLQTRNLTQPDQADTLGLFGNPTDFS
tara:strand:- start:54 stop:1202 length:1149 start_codon:yes stop_codon:yes gene_type:complete